MTAYDEKLNVVRDQQREQLAQVLVQHLPVAPDRLAAFGGDAQAAPAVTASA